MVVHYVSSVQLYYTKAKTSTCGHYRTVIIYDDTEILIDNEKSSFKKVNLNQGEILKDSYILIYENQNNVSNFIDKRTPFSRSFQKNILYLPLHYYWF